MLRPKNEDGSKGNAYRLPPLVAKYASPDGIEAAFRAAIVRITTGELPYLKLPAYAAVPPAEGHPRLRVA